MRHNVRRSALGAVIACSLLLSACGGGGAQNLPKVSAPPKNPFAYDASKPLQVQVAGRLAYGPVNVTILNYVTFDGTRVPALFASPRGHRASGCLMYQPGAGAPKRDAATIWPLAARLDLAVFTIDPRLTGARATPGVSGAAQAIAVRSNLSAFVDYLRDNVIDLRRGLDYLEGLASCHHDVGYMGVSQGATFGALLAGADTRIRAAVLASIAASFREATFYSPEGLLGIENDPSKLSQASTELAPLNQTRWVAKISPRPVMLVEGLSDPIVPPAGALAVIAAAREPKVALFHPGGHNPFAAPYGRAVSAQIAAFLSKTLLHGARSS